MEMITTYDDGDPDGMLASKLHCKIHTTLITSRKDPLLVARAMSRRGIVLVFNESQTIVV